MSKIALTPNASGSGTFTLASPNSDTDRTLTLPDEAGTVLTSASDIPSSQITGSLGITEADQWRLTADFEINSTFSKIAGSWERADALGAGSFGTGVTESSGVFTLPSTGYWYAWVQAGIYTTVNNSYIAIAVGYSSDSGSTFTATTANYGNNNAGGNYVAVQSNGYIFDITNTSTQKLSFMARSQQGSNVFVTGDTTDTRSGIFFIRLGDT